MLVIGVPGPVLAEQAEGTVRAHDEAALGAGRPDGGAVGHRAIVGADLEAGDTGIDAGLIEAGRQEGIRPAGSVAALAADGRRHGIRRRARSYRRLRGI